ncbi:MAG: Ribosomal RNA small subunit methyltransferase B [Alphaproteobacteria bacterium MarineAlpha9_Bin4]|nr:hypothetical protein [Pelagibacterales bacterium]PPR25047.1 MAG: Ribosomal RNA small subunit methyltransferase B [Alphaproteobacteria bacterium MarineAlpha9_Bin4]|tara:strand:+ start:209 stop:1465 length:1257 start_codon:yes stop_codon:yes gene_type:complete
MKKGAIIASSIELVSQILTSNTKIKFIISSFFRKNKFAGSKDKNNIKELVFKFLKNYFTLKAICINNHIKFSDRNAMLLLYFSKNKDKNLNEIYEGRFSIKPEFEDKRIHSYATSLEHDIIPSLPNWLEEKLSFEFKTKKKNNFESILNEPRFDIRVNNSVIARDKVSNLLLQNNILSKKTNFSPLGITIEKRVLEKEIKKIKQNFFEVQDEGSQIVTILSGAKSGMRVLDYCAGKGTKTLAIFNEMKGIGDIYVNDIDENRLRLLRKRLAFLKIDNEANTFSDKKKFESYFDLILLDVPCSGSGIWRRRPESIIRLNKNEYKKNTEIQIDLLNKVVKYCKKGGIISYITCSIFKDENENQIKKFLANNKAFKILDINLILKNKFNHTNLNSSYKWLTITPSFLNSDGFFICLLKKYA